MTREEVKKLLPIIKAFSDGETIQHLNITKDKWEDVDEFVYHGSVKSYRIKPEPKYRPFKDAKECWQEMQKHQPFGWYKDKDGDFFMVNTVSNQIIQSLQAIFKNGCTFADGTPFGVKEE